MWTHYSIDFQDWEIHFTMLQAENNFNAGCNTITSIWLKFHPVELRIHIMLLCSNITAMRELCDISWIWQTLEYWFACITFLFEFSLVARLIAFYALLYIKCLPKKWTMACPRFVCSTASNNIWQIKWEFLAFKT